MDIEIARHDNLLFLGRRGENMARKVLFDLSDWYRKFGPGEVQLLAQRPGEDTPYPCDITVEGDNAAWVIRTADVHVVSSGGSYGRCELIYTVDGRIVKSEIWLTIIQESLGPLGSRPPEAQQGWVDQVLQAGRDTADAARKAAEDAYKAEDAAARAAAVGEIADKVLDHTRLLNRSAPDQHPIASITDLTAALDARVQSESIKEISNQDVLRIWNSITI